MLAKREAKTNHRAHSMVTPSSLRRGPCELEVDAYADVQPTRRVVLRAQHPKSRWVTEVVDVPATAIGKLHYIEYVDRLQVQPCADPLGERNDLRQAHVHVPARQTANASAGRAQIAEQRLAETAKHSRRICKCIDGTRGPDSA